jgi:nuclear pore complex protein Nup93
LISVKYGENYFNAFQQPYTYFQALFLTGQFESAIGFFARMSLLRPQAVHLAIVLNELGILLVGDLESRPVAPLEKDQGEGGMKSLNFYRLISTFVETFDGANARVALNYLFALRNMKDANRVSLFSVCVSKLAIASKDFNVFFGAMNEDGCRTPGVLDAMGIDIKPVAEYCASESENRGMLEDAVILHDLIGNHESALKVLIAIMAANASSTNAREGSSRERIQTLAISLAERYQIYPPNVTKTMLTSFYTLLDCMTFFDEFSSLHYDNCITILEKIKIIPLEKEEIDRCVAKFENLAVEIRRCVPELILATVECLQARYKKLRSEKRGAFLSADSDSSQIALLTDIKSKCKALVTFCGLLPYYMNGDIYTRVMQIEVQMN